MFLTRPSRRRFSAISFSWDQLQNPIPLTYGTSADDDLILPFSKVELIDPIRRTKATTPGEDRISASFLKGLKDHSLDQLLEVYNSIFSSGDIPPSWSSAVILPIPKHSKPRKDPFFIVLLLSLLWHVRSANAC